MNKEQKVKYLLDKNPKLKESNTELYIAFLEYILDARGRKLPHHVKEVIREYKPESITRAKRKLTESTNKQKEAAEKARRTKGQSIVDK